MFELFKIMPLPTPELFVPVPTISRVSDKKMAVVLILSFVFTNGIVLQVCPPFVERKKY